MSPFPAGTCRALLPVRPISSTFLTMKRAWLLARSPNEANC